MRYTYLGRTGVQVSRICLGCMSYGSRDWRPWILEEEQSMPFFRRAIELGINFFDTANVYSLGQSEEVTGKALRRFARMDEVVVATKVYFPEGKGPNRSGLSRKHVQQACEASLRRLGVECIDLYQIHRFDRHTALEEIMEGLDALVRQGKVRYLGASSMFAWELATSLGVSALRGLSRFVSMQPHYNLLYREEEREMLPLCAHEGLAVLPWSPLARGHLARPVTREASSARRGSDRFADELYGQEGDAEVRAALDRLSEARGESPAKLALAWLLHRSEVTAPIIGATRLSHLEDAAAATEISLGRDELAALELPYRPHPVLGMGTPNTPDDVRLSIPEATR